MTRSCLIRNLKNLWHDVGAATYSVFLASYRVIGQGAHAFVFEVSNEIVDDPRVLKLFENSDEYEIEQENLIKLSSIMFRRLTDGH